VGLSAVDGPVPVSTNGLPPLLFARDGLACHTNGFQPRQLVWRAVPAPQGVRAVHPHPEVSATVYTVAADGLQRSDDFAATWRRTPLSGLPAKAEISDLAIQPGVPETLCLGTRANGVWISRDGGQTAQPLGSKATGLASDTVEAVLFSPGDIWRRTLLVSHGSAAEGLSRGNTQDGSWTVVGRGYHVFRTFAASPQGRDIFLSATPKDDPEGCSLYYANTLNAYWLRLVGDVCSTDAVWFSPHKATYVTTLDSGLLRVAADGAAVQRFGGGDLPWAAAASTWEAHAEREVLALYQPTVRGLLWTTNDVVDAVDQSHGLYRGEFVSDASRVRPNAGGARFYGNVNGVLWVGAAAGPLRVDTVAVSPATLTVAPAVLRDGSWNACDHALRQYAGSRRAAAEAGRLARLLRDMNTGLPAWHITVEAQVTAPTGTLPHVTADLSRLGLAAETPLVALGGGRHVATVDLTDGALMRAAGQRKAEWRSGWPGPMAVTVAARVPGMPPAGGVGCFTFHTAPEAIAFGNDHWALYLGDAVGTVSFASERLNPDEYWVPLHQRLTVGPGAWRAPIWHMAMRANIADYAALTFRLRATGAADAEVYVHLYDKPVDVASTRTPGVPIMAGGFIAGGAVTTDYRRVTIPVARLLKDATGFRPESFAAVAFSGESAASRTYLIDGLRLEPTMPEPDEEVVP
jgi:hypothetical protein